MTSEQIEDYIEKNKKKDSPVSIYFKDRSPVTGIFIDSRDYNELKAKNFWRIVSSAHFEQWKQTKDENLARIFNGFSFTRLTKEN